MDYDKIKVKKKLVHFLSKDFKNFKKKKKKKNLANFVHYPPCWKRFILIIKNEKQIPLRI